MTTTGDQSLVDEAAEIRPALVPASGREDLGRRLSRASLFALVVYVGGAGVTSLAQLLIAHLIGTTSYGTYAYAFGWATTLAAVAALGFNVALLRLVPAYRAQGSNDLARGVVLFAVRTALIAAVLVSAFGVTVALAEERVLAEELEKTLLLAMLAVPIVTGCALGSAIVRAFGGVISALMPERVVRDGLLLVLVCLMFLAGNEALDAPAVMAAALVSSGVAVVVILVTAIRMWPAEMRRVGWVRVQPQWLATIPPLTLIAVLDILVGRSGVMVLGWTGDLSGAGIFALALNVSLLVALPRVAVTTMFSPVAADLHIRQEMGKLQHLFRRATLLGAGGALLVGLPLLFSVGPLLHLLGGEYQDGTAVARILICGYMLAALFGPAQNLLTMTGNEWAAAGTLMLGAAANAIGCTLGVLLAGPIGVAIGVAAAQIIWNGAMAISIRRRLDIVPHPFTRRTT